MCGGDDIWSELLPLWFAHIGCIELLVGVICGTHGMDMRTILQWRRMLHIGFFALHCRVYIFELSSCRLQLSCHVVQHISYAAEFTSVMSWSKCSDPTLTRLQPSGSRC